MIFVGLAILMRATAFYTDCKCLKDVFPILQNLTKNIHKLCVQDKIASEDLENSQYLSFGKWTVFGIFSMYMVHGCYSTELNL